MTQDDDKHPLPLSRIRAKLARPRGYRRIDALLSSQDAAGAVGALSVVDLYQLVKEVGFSDSLDLIELATPKQLRGCIDMDVWDRDRVQEQALIPWLAGLAEAGFEKLTQVWEQLDSELTALTLQKFTRIYDLSLGEEAPENSDWPILNTVDTFFALELISDDGEIDKLIHRVIDDLYRGDMVLARHTLMSAHSEPPAELEEMSYRWRSGRMADLGYADFYEALEVFRPIDASSITMDEATADAFTVADDSDGTGEPGELPVAWAEQVVGRSFLARALGELTDAAEAQRAETALVVLVNKVLSALRVSPGNVEEVRRGTLYTSSTLALGLEVVAQGDIERAGELLRSVSFTRLHRAGYTTSQRLTRLARAVAPRATTAGSVDTAVLGALLAPQPLMAGELGDPATAVPRPFESLADIRCAAEQLTRLALRIAIADALGVDLLALASMPEPRPALDDYIRTAMVRVMAGGEFNAARLTQTELSAFSSGAFKAGELTAAAREATWQAVQTWAVQSELSQGAQYLPGLIKAWLSDIERTFGPIVSERGDASDIDPRFVDTVLLATQLE